MKAPGLLPGLSLPLSPHDVATVPMGFEVTTLPVADVDRAKAFYQRPGWRLDIDFKPTIDAARRA